MPLLASICENTKLKKINLAWNPLVPKSNYGQAGLPEYQTPADVKVTKAYKDLEKKVT